MADIDMNLMDAAQERGENGEFACPVCGDSGVESVYGGHGSVLELPCSTCGGDTIDDSCPFDTILARTPYFVLPKLAIQAMPIGWRRRFAALLQEAEDAGMETPSYHVFRDDRAYTLIERSDSEDEYSPIESVHRIRGDEWADYRHGDIRELCPMFKGLT